VEKPWFGIKRFWGWYPATWKGYITITLMFFGIAFSIIAADLNSHSVSDTLIKAFPFISLTVTLTILVASVKGVKPRFGDKTDRAYSPDNPKAYLLLPVLILPVIVYYLFFGGFLGAFVLGLVFVMLSILYRKLSG
jgi:hypothetical protein